MRSTRDYNLDTKLERGEPQQDRSKTLYLSSPIYVKVSLYKDMDRICLTLFFEFLFKVF